MFNAMFSVRESNEHHILLYNSIGIRCSTFLRNEDSRCFALSAPNVFVHAPLVLFSHASLPRWYLDVQQANAQSRLKSKEIFRTKKEAQSNDRMQTRIAGLLACKRIRVCHAPFGLLQERHFYFPGSISIVDQSFFFASASLSPHASNLSKTCEQEVRLWCIPLPDENSTCCTVR